MDNIKVKPLEPDFFKIALKDSGLIIKEHWLTLLISILLMWGLSETLWDYFNIQNSWIGFIGVLQAFYVAQLMVLMRASKKRGLDLIVETLMSLPKMFYFYMTTSGKAAITTSILFIGLLLASQYFIADGISKLILYSDFLLFFGIYIGFLETSLVIFLVAHMQANEESSSEEMKSMVLALKKYGNWKLFKFFIVFSMMFVFLSAFIKIGPLVLIVSYLLGLMYSSILYQMIKKPRKRLVMADIRAAETSEIDSKSVVG